MEVRPGRGGPVITDLLVDRPWLSPSALGVLVVLGPLIGRRLVARPRLTWWLAGAFSLPVVVLTLAPVDRRLFERCTVHWSLPTPWRVELMANVVLFVAPVLFAAVATRRPVVTLVAASALSVGLETLQAVAMAIGRSCDTNDWLSNTIGAVVGAMLAAASLHGTRITGNVMLRLREVTAERTPDDRPP